MQGGARAKCFLVLIFAFARPLSRMVADIKAGTFDRSWVDAPLTRLNYFVERAQPPGAE